MSLSQLPESQPLRLFGEFGFDVVDSTTSLGTNTAILIADGYNGQPANIGGLIAALDPQSYVYLDGISLEAYLDQLEIPEGAEVGLWDTEATLERTEELLMLHQQREADEIAQREALQLLNGQRLLAAAGFAPDVDEQYTCAREGVAAAVEAIAALEGPEDELMADQRQALVEAVKRTQASDTNSQLRVFIAEADLLLDGSVAEELRAANVPFIIVTQHEDQ